MKWGINDTQHCTITDVWFLIHCYNTTDYKTLHNNRRITLLANARKFFDSNTIKALSYYDTNNDGVVNATDSRFEELKLWIDSDQDGVTDTGELKTLSEMGVTSLKLNDPTKPYIPTSENTNTIIQETTFTDANGEGVMRDVLFRYENNTSNTEGVYFDMDGNGIKEKMLTWTDPNQWMVVGNNIWIESKNTRSAA